MGFVEVAGKIGIAGINVFSLESGENVDINIPQCSIVYFNVSGGGNVYEVVRIYNGLLVKSFFDNGYTLEITSVDVSTIRVKNTATYSGALTIRYNYIALV